MTWSKTYRKSNGVLMSECDYDNLADLAEMDTASALEADKEKFNLLHMEELQELSTSGSQLAGLAAREIDQLNRYAYALECALLCGFSNFEEVREMIAMIREMFAPDVDLPTLPESRERWIRGAGVVWTEANISRCIESDKTPYSELFGTPERLARFIVEKCGYDCPACLIRKYCPCSCKFGVEEEDYDVLLEWLRGGKNGA